MNLKTKIDLTITNFGTFWKAKINSQDLSKKEFCNLLEINPQLGFRRLQNFENNNYKVNLTERDCE